jgi:hypothetical protein
MQGAADTVIGSIGEKAETVLCGVNGIKPGFLFFEYVVVSIR